ncbi:MAG: type I-MYXAN CRISPR-associated Cas8a1/Cmx1 [Cyanobacteria bacterium]|jgi:CRISPR-associated protein Cas8a1/Csx13|nr:type I-MYXAN CRISPR-associated Cas8a1/Cmx1 [Cyanobacteria bacterium GSL.Bin1]
MTQIILSLFDPDTLLPHRAGTAGLSLALSALSQENAPLQWETNEEAVKLFWECSDREVVKWLVSNTYQIQDGYLNVPALKLDRQGKYTFTQGVTSTLLQHGQQRSLSKNSVAINFQIDEGQPEIQLNVRPLLECYYTRDLKEAFTSKGKFKSEIPLKGHHLPGLVESFVNGAYKESPKGFLALLFLPLACGYYSLPGWRSALVIPEVINLKEWMRRRQSFSGRTYKHFRSSSAGESGLKFLLQEQTASDAKTFKVNYCEVYQLGGQPWDTSQTYLKQAVYRIHPTKEMLSLYEEASYLFPSRVVKNDKGETWLAVSKVLPWIADNLIAGNPWYTGFYEFRKANELYGERQGLVKMTQQYLTEEERSLFDAVQGAFKVMLANEHQEATKQGRQLDYKQVTDKAIYRLQRPSSQQQFATALVSFLSRFRAHSAKGKGLEIYGWLQSNNNWRRARDLALLAIATYKGKQQDQAESSNAEDNGLTPEVENVDQVESQSYEYPLT